MSQVADATTFESPATAAPTSGMDDLWTVETTRQAETVEQAASEAGTDAPADPAPPAPPTPGTSDATEDRPRDASGQFTPKTGKPRNDPRARVEQATAREAAAKAELQREREEAAKLRAELDALRRPATPPPAPEPTKAEASKYATRPKPSVDEIGTKYQTYEDFNEDLADWKFEVRMAERDAQAHVLAAQREAETRATAYRTRVQQFTATMPDFPQAIAAVNDIAPTPSIVQAILASEQGPALAYYLATHREAYVQLVQDTHHLSADAAPMVRRFLESQVSAAAAAPTPDSARVARPSAAQPPINRVGGTASATPIDPDDLEFGPEYIRRENQRERKEREARRW